MADISTELANIMSAIYGEEVRTSIHDAIQKMNTQLNSAASSTLNALGFRGDFSSGTLDQLSTENDRGIWRLLPTGDYTDYPEDYQKSRGGLLFIYANGSYCRQELRYYKLTEGTGADSSKVWTRTLSGGEGIFSDFTDWIVEAPLSFKGDYRNGASLNALINDADKGIYRLLGSSTYSGMPSDFVQTVSGCLKVYVFGTNVVQELSYISNVSTYECISWKRAYTGSWGEWVKNIDTTLTKSGTAADAKTVGDKALISKQVYLPVGGNANLNNFYAQGIYSVMAPQGTQNWPFENTSGLLIVVNASNDLGVFITYAVAQIAICEGKYAFRSSIIGESGPKYSDWVIYSIDDTLSVEGAAADAKAVGDAISGAVENVVSSKGLAMSTDPEHPVKDLNDYKTPGIYYVGATRVTNWAFDDNYKGVLVVFNPMTSAAAMTDSIVQMAFSNGEFSYRMFNGYGTGQIELWSDWIKNDNGRLLEIIESIADVNSVQNEIEATTNQNYYLEKTSATTCTVKSSTGTELVLYSVAVETKKNYRITASNVASIDNAILAFATRALADNVGCSMLIDNTGGPTIDYSYSPTQDGYLFLSKGTNASMTYKIYEVEDHATLKVDKTLSTENVPADAKETGKIKDSICNEYSNTSTYRIGDYCVHNNSLYACITDISAPEEFIDEHWTSARLANDFSDLRAGLTVIESTTNDMLIKKGAVDLPLQFTEGYAISRETGQYVTLSVTTFAATKDYIAIPVGTLELSTTAFMGGSSAYGFAFYTLSKEYISGGQSFDNIVIPDNARFIRITDYNANSEHSNKTVTVVSVVNDIYENIESMADTIELIESNEYALHPSFILQTAINNATGNRQSLSGYNEWASTDFIRIPAYTKVIESNANCPSSRLGCSFYDSNKNFISGSSISNYVGFCVEIKENYKYIRFTSHRSDGDHSSVYAKFVYKYHSDIDYLIDGNITDSNVQMTQEGAISPSTGEVLRFTGYPNYRYSNFIEIPEYTATILLNCTAPGLSIGLAFYDSNRTFIDNSGVSNYDNPTVTVEKQYKYIRFTDSRSGEPNVRISFVCGSSILYYNDESFEDAVKSGKLLKGTYTLDSIVTLSEGQSLIGTECTVNVTGSGQIKMSNGCKISGIKFVGNWTPTRVAGDGSTYTSYGYVPLITYQDLYDGNSDALFGANKSAQDAVIIIQNNSAHNAIVDGCTFENFDRLVIYGGGQRHQENTNPVICNNYFSDCRMGVYIQAEFVRCYSNEYLRCIVGCYLYGGNSNNFGEIFKCCDVGYYFPVNAVAHNEITSCETAHCGLAGIYVRYLNKALGCVVNGCHFPDAPIIGVDVNNLYITGCIISTYLKYDSGKHNAITCCNIRREYLYGNAPFQVPSDTLITLNRAMNDDSDANVNWPTT